MRIPVRWFLSNVTMLSFDRESVLEDSDNIAGYFGIRHVQNILLHHEDQQYCPITAIIYQYAAEGSRVTPRRKLCCIFIAS